MRTSTPTSQHKFILRIAGFDLCWILLAPFIALWMRGDNYIDVGELPFSPSPTFQYALITSFSTIIAFIILRVSEGITHHFSARDAVAILLASCLSVMASISAVFTISRLEGVPRSAPLIYGLVLAFGLLFHRLLMRSLYEKNEIIYDLKVIHPRHQSVRRVILVGLDPFAIAAIRLVEKQNPITTQVIAAFSLQGKYDGRTISTVRVFTDVYKLGAIIDEYNIHGIAVNEIWFSDNSKYINEHLREYLQHEAEARSISYKSISEAFALDIHVGDAGIENNLTELVPTLNEVYLLVKRALDVFVATILSIMLAPFVALTVLIVVCDVGFPFIFWQERLGRFGKLIRLYKLRTMKNPVTKDGLIIPDSERVSSLGKLVRKFRLDESPQLISIIVGEMSGIGPRPLLQREQIKGATYRLLLRPGITGWAQVNGGELLSFEEKNILDSWYVFNASIKIDIVIVIKTIGVLLHGVSRNDEEIRKAKEWLESKNITV